MGPVLPQDDHLPRWETRPSSSGAILRLSPSVKPSVALVSLMWIFLSEIDDVGSAFVEEVSP